MSEKRERILSEGVEIRLVSEDKEQIEQIGDALSRWAKENLPIVEFYDGGTILSTHPRYKGTYVRRIYLKIGTVLKEPIGLSQSKEQETTYKQPEIAYNELDQILRQEGAVVELDTSRGRRCVTFRKINGIPVVYRYSKPLKGGNHFFFGLSPKDLYHGKWVLFICGFGARTFVIPQNWLEQHLKNAPLARNGQWKITIRKKHLKWVMYFGAGRVEEITPFLNHFRSLVKEAPP